MPCHQAFEVSGCPIALDNSQAQPHDGRIKLVPHVMNDDLGVEQNIAYTLDLAGEYSDPIVVMDELVGYWIPHHAFPIASSTRTAPARAFVSVLITQPSLQGPVAQRRRSGAHRAGGAAHPRVRRVPRRPDETDASPWTCERRAARRGRPSVARCVQPTRRCVPQEQW
jgi:hypothetical protein